MLCVFACVLECVHARPCAVHGDTNGSKNGRGKGRGNGEMMGTVGKKMEGAAVERRRRHTERLFWDDARCSGRATTTTHRKDDTQNTFCTREHIRYRMTYQCDDFALAFAVQGKSLHNVATPPWGHRGERETDRERERHTYTCTLAQIARACTHTHTHTPHTHTQTHSLTHTNTHTHKSR